jgi:catechol 2,3-dioxygenase-like lactoylglutathione lyase family enzyme
VIDHVGYLVRDLDAAVARMTQQFGTEVTREVDRPQWSLFGYYAGQLEIFTFTDPVVLAARLPDGVDEALDHVAWRVDDIEAAMARFPDARWSGPDLRTTVHEPFVLGDVRHIWTDGLQLVEQPRAV